MATVNLSLGEVILIVPETETPRDVEDHGEVDANTALPANIAPKTNPTTAPMNGCLLINSFIKPPSFILTGFASLLANVFLKPYLYLKSLHPLLKKY